MENGAPQAIDVTVTFLEMHAAPAVSSPIPYNRQIALLKT
ncbi:GNAT family N-acetyltransferase, partial [Mesorhizobium sp. M2A.F.Ca.ET.046.02.1.1]